MVQAWIMKPSWIAALLVVLAAPAAYGQARQRLAIPAYFGVERKEDWKRIEAAGDAVQLVVLDWDIFVYRGNPASCPPKRDLKPTPEMTAQVDRLRQHTRVFGYVDTAYGKKPPAEVDCWI